MNDMIEINSFIVSAIINGSDKIEHAINSIPEGSYILATYSGILSGLAAFFAAWSLNFFTKKELSKKNKLKRIANVAYKKIEELENDSINYWLQKKSLKNRINIENLEIKIKSSFITIQDVFEELYNKDGLNISDKIKLETSNFELYDSITGGDFEVFSRPSCKERAITITTLSSEIKLILLRYDF